MASTCALCGRPTYGGLFPPLEWVDMLREDREFLVAGDVFIPLCGAHYPEVERLKHAWYEMGYDDVDAEEVRSDVAKLLSSLDLNALDVQWR